MAALPASLRVAAMPTPVKCSMPSTSQSEVLSALYEWEMMLKPLACAALEIALKTSPLQSSLRVLTNIVWASACGPAPARVTAATAASVFSGVVFLRAIGLITLFSWVHLGHTYSRPLFVTTHSSATLCGAVVMQGIGLSSCWNQPQQVTAIGQHVHQSVSVRRDISYPVHIVQHCLSQRLSIAVHCDAEQISMLQ